MSNPQEQAGTYRGIWPEFMAYYLVLGVFVWFATAGAAYLGGYPGFSLGWLVELTAALVFAAAVAAVLRTAGEVHPR